MVKIAIVHCCIHENMYEHISEMSDAVKKGVESIDGATCDIYKVPATNEASVLQMCLLELGLPTESKYPLMTADEANEYDGILFGCADPGDGTFYYETMSTFMDATDLWWGLSHPLVGKAGGVFVSMGKLDNQESISVAMVSFMARHGMVIVSLGDAANSGSPFGVYCQGAPSDLQKSVAEKQGKYFAVTAAKLAAQMLVNESEKTV